MQFKPYGNSQKNVLELFHCKIKLSGRKVLSLKEGMGYQCGIAIDCEWRSGGLDRVEDRYFN